MNHLSSSHWGPFLPCVLAAPRWLAVFSDLPEFPAPSNAPDVRVCAAGFEFAGGLDRCVVEGAEPEEYPRSGFTAGVVAGLE